MISKQERDRDDAIRFVMARDHFIAVIGTLPPPQVYDSHPSLSAVALALRYATRKRFKGEEMDEEFRIRYSLYDARCILWNIVEDDGKLLHCADDYEWHHDWLIDWNADRRLRLNEIVDDQRKQYGYCTYNLSEEARETVNIPYVKVATMLINPDPPERSNHQHVYMKAWHSLRSISAPSYRSINKKVSWSRSW